MNSIKNFGLKFAMIFVALLCANYAFAQDEIKASLKIENVSINNYDTKWIDICLDNETPVAALQFKFSLPEELEFADGENTEPELNYDRLVKNNHVVALNVNNGMVVVQSLNLKDIKGNEGWIMKLPVKVKEGMLASGKTVEIAVSKIEFTNGNGTVLSRQNEFPVYVSLDPFSYTGYLTPNPLAIYPAGTQNVAFNLKNVYTDSEDEAPVVGLTFVLNLPEGLSVDEESIEVNSERVFNRATISYDSSTGVFMLADLGQNKPLKTGFNDGALFTFNLEAADNFVAKDTKIELSDLEVSAVVGAFAVEGVCEDCALVNTADILANKTAYDEVVKAIDALQAEYDEALAAAKKDNPEFDFSEFEEIITKAINEAKEGAAQALAAANEDGVEFSFPFDGEEIENMIKEMQNAPAKAELEAANKAAYGKVVEAIDAVEAEYEEAIAAAKVAYPEFDFSEWEEIITNAIKEAKEGAAQALAAATEDGVAFDYLFNAEDIENMIKDMQAQPAREAANQAAYDEVIATLDAIEKAFNAAVAETEKKYPDYDITEWKEIISGQIKEQKEAAATALKVANEEGVEFSYPFDEEYLYAMIEEMKQAPVKEPLQAANLEACNEVLKTIDALQEEYENALAEILASNPDFDASEFEEIITNAINEARDGATKALDQANEDGVEYNFTFSGEDIENMIKEMQGAAAQAELEAANKVAYDKLVESIDAVEAKYEEALAAAKKENPDFDFSEWEEIITNAINQAKEGAAQALESANEDGEEYNFPFDAEEIENMIKEMQNAPAKAALEAANKAAYDKVIASIDAVEAEYNVTLAAVKEAYPEFDFSEFEKDITKAIEEAKEGAAQALAAANDEGIAFEYLFNAEDIENMIKDMQTVPAREAANKAAYDKVIAEIEAVEAEYEEALAAAKVANPEFDFSEWEEIITNAIEEAKEGADQALAAANDEGVEFDYLFNAEDIENMIEDMKNSVKGSAVNAIEAEVAAGKAYIFTLDGKMHQNVVRGEVNVIVRENSTSKVFIK